MSVQPRDSSVNMVLRKLRSSNLPDLLVLHGGSECLVLVRNVILARSLGATELGVLTMVAMALRLVEMLTDFSVDRLLISSPKGGHASFQAAAHGFTVVRGIAAGFLLATSAPLWAGLFEAPEILPVIVWLGLVPAIKGFSHLDCKRRQRHLNFRSAVYVEIVAQIAAISACLLLIPRVTSFHVGAIAFVAHAVGYLVISHVVAERAYRLQISRSSFRNILSFGWPLACNGLLMFAILQGDRLVVGVIANPQELARYALAFQLALLPTLMVNRIANSLLLPILSRQTTKLSFANRTRNAQSVLVSLAVLLAFCSLVCINPALEFLYGPEFVVSYWLIGAISASQLFRICRVVPAVAALSIGASQIPLGINLARVSGFGLAIGAACLGGNLLSVAFANVVGELTAVVFAGLYLSRCGATHFRSFASEILLSSAVVAFCLVAAVASPQLRAFACCLAAVGIVHFVVSGWRGYLRFGARASIASDNACSPLESIDRPQICH